MLQENYVKQIEEQKLHSNDRNLKKKLEEQKFQTDNKLASNIRGIKVLFKRYYVLKKIPGS